MVIKTGKLLLLWGLFLSNALYSLNAGEAELHIRSRSGLPLTSVAVGIPFVIEIIIKDADNQEPVLAGLDKLEILNKQVMHSTSIVNGVTSAKRHFQYTVKSNQPGAFSIGSNTSGKPLEIEITKAADTKKSNDLSAEVSYRLLIDKKEVVVGEKVPFVLQFSYSDTSVHLEGIQEPEGAGITLGELSKPETRELIHNGVPSTVIEFRGYLYAEREGELIIPSLRAVYTAQIKQKDDEWLWARSFFGSSKERRELYSSPVTLKVHALPPTTKKVNGIGKFKAAFLSLNKTEIDQLSAAVLTLSIEGDGNIDRIKAPQLLLPSQLKYYESKSTITTRTKGSIKNFEYIIQARESGTYHILPQEFTYFDTESKVYKTLKTNALDVIVKPSDNSVTNQYQPQPIIDILKEQEPLSFDKQFQELQKTIVRWPVIPTNYFLLLLALPLLFLLVIHIYRLFYREYSKKCLSSRKFIFSQAYRALRKAEVKNDVTQVYGIVKHALSCYLLNSVSVSDDEIMNNLSDCGLNNDYIKELQKFLNQSLALAGFARDYKVEEKQFFKQAYKWLTLIEQTTNKKCTVNAKYYCSIFLCFYVGASMCISQENKSVKTLAAIRLAQQDADFSTLQKIDQLAKELKETNGNAHERPYLIMESINKIISGVPLLLWQILLLMLWWCFIFFANLLSNGNKLAIVSLILLLGSCWAIATYYRNTIWGIVKSDRASLHIGPGSAYPVKGALEYLDEIHIIKSSHCWYYGKSAQEAGWISAQDVEIVNCNMDNKA